MTDHLRELLIEAAQAFGETFAKDFVRGMCSDLTLDLKVKDIPPENRQRAELALMTILGKLDPDKPNAYEFTVDELKRIQRWGRAVTSIESTLDLEMHSGNPALLLKVSRYMKREAPKQPEV